MLAGKRIVVVMPAYRAERTLRRTFEAVPHDIVDEVNPHRRRVQRRHRGARPRRSASTRWCTRRNRGYGGNQKTCYARR